jgi:hypothetical protein
MSPRPARRLNGSQDDHEWPDHEELDNVTAEETRKAGRLPDHLATTVVVTARQAFVHGMQLSSAIAAIAAVGLAILALITLHAQPSPSQTNTDTENDRARRRAGAADG